EVATLARGLTDGIDAVAGEVAASDQIVASRRAALVAGRSLARRRAAAPDAIGDQRSAPYPERRAAQATARPLPVLPTTTIGSFPQTAELRDARRDHVAGAITDARYRAVCQTAIADVIAEQE